MTTTNRSPLTRAGKDIFVIETSLGWQVVAPDSPTHIAQTEGDALGYARSIAGSACILVLDQGQFKLRIWEIAA